VGFLRFHSSIGMSGALTSGQLPGRGNRRRTGCKVVEGPNGLFECMCLLVASFLLLLTLAVGSGSAGRRGPSGRRGGAGRAEGLERTSLGYVQRTCAPSRSMIRQSTILFCSGILWEEESTRASALRFGLLSPLLRPSSITLSLPVQVYVTRSLGHPVLDETGLMKCESMALETRGRKSARLMAKSSVLCRVLCLEMGNPHVIGRARQGWGSPRSPPSSPAPP
jgi:hypothetical protein